jgi:hypothetical protein
MYKYNMHISTFAHVSLWVLLLEGELLEYFFLDLQIPSIKIERYDNRERERGSKGIGKEKFVCGRERERS